MARMRHAFNKGSDLVHKPADINGQSFPRAMQVVLIEITKASLAVEQSQGE